MLKVKGGSTVVFPQNSFNFVREYGCQNSIIPCILLCPKFGLEPLEQNVQVPLNSCILLKCPAFLVISMTFLNCILNEVVKVQHCAWFTPL